MVHFFEFLNSCTANRAAAYMFFTLVLSFAILTSINTIISSILNIIMYKIDSKNNNDKQ
jgi:hypothetical protein